MANSSKTSKPRKPYPDFPLFPHQAGQWAKKIRGKLVYFGVWSDWQAALDRYKREADYLHRGLPVPEAIEGVTVADACNAFLTAKEARVASGELSKRSFGDYHGTAKTVAECFGRDTPAAAITPADFQRLRTLLAKRYGPTRLGNEITRTKMIFTYAFEAGLLESSLRFGPDFKPPGKLTRRKQRLAAKKEHGQRAFEPEQLKAILGAAKQPMKAMILLAINGGMGNHDVGSLTFGDLDLERGWIDFPRPKTGIERRFPLWPETVAAIREAIEARPRPKLERLSDLVFITKYGGAWATDTPDSPVSKQFRKLLDDTETYRPGLSFYAIRHTFRTIADAHHDRPAIDMVMGHGDNSMADHYREGIADDRLQAVVDVVHAWLFPPPPAPEDAGEDAGAQDAAEGGAE